MARKKIILEEREGILGKECTKCLLWKELDSYSRDKKGTGGRVAKCKECETDYYHHNKEIVIERVKNWYKENKEHKCKYDKEYRQRNSDKLRAGKKKWYFKNHEAELEKRTLYRQENKEYLKQWRIDNSEYFREWHKINKHIINFRKKEKRKTDPSFLMRERASSQRRRARVRRLPSTLSKEEILKLELTFDNRCVLTGDMNVHLDHVIPLATGHGGTIYGNIIPLRADLNLSKSDRNIFEWFEANRQRFNLEQWRFDRLIEWLGKANGMTVDEYRAYVYECHAKPNAIDEYEAI